MKSFLIYSLIGLLFFGETSCKKLDLRNSPSKDDTSHSSIVTQDLIAIPLVNPGTMLASNDNIVRDTTFELNAMGWTESNVVLIARGIFTFNLSQIPPTDSIYSATLSLFFDSASTSRSGQVSLTNSNASLIQRVTTYWDPSTTTWANQPQTTSLDEAFLPQSDSVNQDYPDINVIALVQDMVANPDSSYGFELRLVNEQPYASLLFCAACDTNPAKRPALKLKYGPK